MKKPILSAATSMEVMEDKLHCPHCVQEYILMFNQG